MVAVIVCKVTEFSQSSGHTHTHTHTATHCLHFHVILRFKEIKDHIVSVVNKFWSQYLNPHSTTPLPNSSYTPRLKIFVKSPNYQSLSSGLRRGTTGFG